MHRQEPLDQGSPIVVNTKKEKSQELRGILTYFITHPTDEFCFHCDKKVKFFTSPTFDFIKLLKH